MSRTYLILVTIYRLIAILCIALSLWLLPATVFGQTATDEPEDEFECALIAIEPVFVQFEIKDRLGSPILSLKRNDILLCEDDVKQYIESFEEIVAGGFGNRRVIYKVGYYPTNDKYDGSIRHIKVKLGESVNIELKRWSLETGYRARTLK